MDRGIAVGSKICARREEQRRHDLHRERVRNMRSQVDTSEPIVTQMDHVRSNLKREQMLEERYAEIDRENRILLKKMSDIMKQPSAPPPTEHRPLGPHSLNRDLRKKELLRITKENQSILKRIQQAQPQYNHVEWEGHHRRSQSYAQNCSEFPLILRTKSTPRTPRSELLPLRGEDSLPAPPMNDVGYQLQNVLKEGRMIGSVYYLLEMTTDGVTLNVSAYDGEAQTTHELVVKERVHRKIYRLAGGDYSLVADRLRIIDGKLVLDDGSTALPSSARVASSASPRPALPKEDPSPPPPAIDAAPSSARAAPVTGPVSLPPRLKAQGFEETQSPPQQSSGSAVPSTARKAEPPKAESPKPHKPASPKPETPKAAWVPRERQLELSESQVLGADEMVVAADNGAAGQGVWPGEAAPAAPGCWSKPSTAGSRIVGTAGSVNVGGEIDFNASGEIAQFRVRGLTPPGSFPPSTRSSPMLTR